MSPVSTQAARYTLTDVDINSLIYTVSEATMVESESQSCEFVTDKLVDNTKVKFEGHIINNLLIHYSSAYFYI